MQTKLIEGARAALDPADSDLVLLHSEALQLHPVSLTVDGMEFDCLAGRLDAEDDHEVWAVDTSGYWLHFDNLSRYLRDGLALALAAHLKREAAEPPRWADIESRLLSAGVPAFPSIRGGA